MPRKRHTPEQIIRKLRIAMVHPRMDARGGAENVVVWLAAELRRRGHEVTIATESFQSDLWSPELLEGLEVVLPTWEPERERWIRSRRLDGWARVAWLARALRGFDWIVPHNAPSVRWATSARRLGRLRGRVVWFCHEPQRKLHLEVTDTHSLGWEARGASRSPNPPLDEHLAKYRHLTTRRRTRWLREHGQDLAAARRCDRIAANSAFTAQNVRAVYGVEAHVCHAGVAAPVESAASAGSYVGIVGSSSPVKNLENALRAVAILFERPGFEDLRVKLTRPSRSSDLASRVAERGLADRVELVGPLDDEELARFYRDARCLIHCPIDEPFGLIPIEALAAGTPSVVSDHGGPAEVIDAGETGVHADPFEPESIADSVASLWSDPEHARRLAVHGQEHVRKYYPVAAMADRFLEILGR